MDNPEGSRFCNNCATKLLSIKEISTLPTESFPTPIQELARGSTFASRYEIVEELGIGGLGKVYRVFDKKIQDEVTLKLLRPEIAADRKSIERLRNELKLARKISHKNVCRMYDLNVEEGVHYITMEYIQGESLKSVLAMTKQLSINSTVYTAKQICDGLAEAHRLGVVHRDLKPSNIIINKEGNAKILDFAIARSLEAEEIRRDIVLSGTPEYMSPEQLEGREIDQRSDIYSLGVMLYEMVTGKLPFEGDTPLSIAVKHKGETPEDPKKLNPQLPENLSDMILKCLEKDKENRYQTAGELLSILSEIKTSILTPEKEITKKSPVKEKVSKVKWKNLLLYGGAVILLVLLLFVGYSLIIERQELRNAIAVLPLQNISGDPEQEYFSDGMTEALIMELSRISGFERVISRTSVMQYKEAYKSLPEIARDLKVGIVLEGSVLLIGEKVRITVQLIEAAADRQLWSKSYERDISDILALQRELALNIAQEIQVVLTPEEATYLARTQLVNPEAYSYYLRGRFFWNKRTRDGLHKAVEQFEQAIGITPDYALAYAGIADAYISMGDYYIMNPKEAYLKAKAAAIKALEMDDQLAEAYTSLANIKHYLEVDWLGVEEGFKKAISIRPNYSTAHAWYSNVLNNLGRVDEALAEAQRAQELDPLSPPIITGVGVTYYFARSYDQAVEQCQKALDVDHEFVWAHSILGDAYIQQSMYDEAISEKELALDYSGGSPEFLAELAYAHGFSGNREEARRIIAELREREKEEYVPVCEVAFAYISIGEREEALRALESAVERMELSWEILNIKIDPLFDGLRSEPRFKELLRKMGLER